MTYLASDVVTGMTVFLITIFMFVLAIYALNFIEEVAKPMYRKWRN